MPQGCWAWAANTAPYITTGVLGLGCQYSPLYHHRGAGPGLPIQPSISPQRCWAWAANTAPYITTGVLGLGCQYSPLYHHRGAGPGLPIQPLYHHRGAGPGLLEQPFISPQGCWAWAANIAPGISTGVLALGCQNSPL